MPALKILVVDDEQLILDSVGRLLTREGHQVITAKSGRQGLDEFAKGHFDVVLSDIRMPDLSGIDFLRELRTHDVDVPVILMTGTPAIETAMTAIELGVFSYLPKPFDFGRLLATINRASQLHQLAKVKRQALELTSRDEQLLGDRATLDQRVHAALGSLYIAFQPIVSVRRRVPIAFEALVRTEEPTLRNPLAFITAAERTGRVYDLGRGVRNAVAAAASAAPADADLFVNLHPADLLDPDLVRADAPLSLIARRVVLEITERASLDEVSDVQARVSALRALGYRIAVDDLGAGYAGLTSLASLEPEVVKIDMSLIRGIDADVRRQRVVQSLTKLSEELKMRVVVEGIETRPERETVMTLGGDLMQGYHFARPAKGFTAIPTTTWD